VIGGSFLIWRSFTNHIDKETGFLGGAHDARSYNQSRKKDRAIDPALDV
jgi:hypothetical protein